MINVRFKIKNGQGNSLKKIFNNININNYNWNIEYSEVYECSDGTLGKNIFAQDVMTGKEFEKDVNTEIYYMIFLTAIAFENTDDIVYVNNYEDFIRSNAKIAFVCVDAQYIDICSKDESVLKQIIKNCKDNEFTNIEIINEEKDVISNFV